MRAAAFVLSMSLLIPVHVSAQLQPAVQLGTRLRITAPDAGLNEIVGTCVGTANGMMDFRPEGDPQGHKLDLTSVSRLEVSTGRKSLGAGKGALTGMLVGGGFGALLAGLSGSSSGLGEDVEAAFTASLAAAGAVIGALVGVSVRKERWEEIPVDELRVGLAPQRHGRFGIGISAAFFLGRTPTRIHR